MTLPVDLLRCPITGQALKPAPAELLIRLREQQGGAVLRNRDGELVAPFEDGLVTMDCAWFYPIRGGIPVLLSGEAALLANPGRAAKPVDGAAHL
jgi:uncharacterized protein YbaR (Trm112 family)